jgi:hypothetical protein
VVGAGLEADELEEDDAFDENDPRAFRHSFLPVFIARSPRSGGASLNWSALITTTAALRTIQSGACMPPIPRPSS